MHQARQREAPADKARQLQDACDRIYTQHQNQIPANAASSGLNVQADFSTRPGNTGRDGLL